MMSITPRSSGQSMAIMEAPCSTIKSNSSALMETSQMKSQVDVDNQASRIESLDEVCNSQQKTLIVNEMTRSHTLHSLSTSSTSSADSVLLQESTSRWNDDFSCFGMDLRKQTQGSPAVPVFDKGMRRTMEPHLRKARLLREKARRLSHVEVHASIASSIGVPYTLLRQERPFLFDVHTHPVHLILAETIGVESLSKLHEQDDLQKLLNPLRHRGGRRKFQEAYDNFVTSFCVPLLHSIAMSKNLFNSVLTNARVTYRYQAFPTIRIVRPGDTSQGPQCDTAKGHSIGCLHFHVPLTPSLGANALYTESHPGKEDWHPLIAKSVGLGFLFDGARCLHFNMENTTEETSVALDFVVSICGEGGNGHVEGHGLCNNTVLEDKFSLEGPGYYDEAIIDVGLGSPTWQIVAKKHGDHLLDPDYRVGFPFA